jgi:hypothetical protein
VSTEGPKAAQLAERAEHRRLVPVTCTSLTPLACRMFNSPSASRAASPARVHHWSTPWENPGLTRARIRTKKRNLKAASHL